MIRTWTSLFTFPFRIKRVELVSIGQLTRRVCLATIVRLAEIEKADFFTITAATTDYFFLHALQTGAFLLSYDDNGSFLCTSMSNKINFSPKQIIARPRTNDTRKIKDMLLILSITIL